MSEKETFIETDKCKIKMDKEGNITIIDCDKSNMNTQEINFLHRVNKNKYFSEV